MVTEIAPAELARRLDSASEKPVLLDVREPFERRMAVILPSIHIPMEEILSRTKEIPRNRGVVVFCHTGVRSMMVAGYLESLGFTSVENLSGGIDAWSVEVDSSVPRYV